MGQVTSITWNTAAPNQVFVQFNTGMDTVSASAVGNYSINNGATVSTASYDAGKSRTTLTLTGLVFSQAYNITTSTSILDAVSNPTPSFTATLLNGGGVGAVREAFAVQPSSGVIQKRPPVTMGSNISPFGTAFSSSGGGVQPLQILSVVSNASNIVVTFNNNLALAGGALVASSYTITGPTPVAITALEVDAPGNILKLTCADQQAGSTYRLFLPLGVQDIHGSVPNPTFSDFTGAHTPVTVTQAISRDERTLDIIFSKAVLQADAIDPTKYTITPTVAVFSAKRITDFYYQLTTGPQDVNSSYQVAIGSIRDINGA